MLNIPYKENASGNNTWFTYLLSDGRRIVITRCKNGHIGQLASHDIAPDGTVHPSVVCQYEGCDFHEFIKLEEFSEHSVPNLQLLNELLRSAHEIAKRKGVDINWEAFENNVRKELLKQAGVPESIDEQEILRATCTPKTYRIYPSD